MSGVTIVLDEASSLLERCATAALAKGLALVGGRAVGTLVRDHLVALNEDRHRYGRNYYAQAAHSVNVRAVPAGAAVSITQIGFRLHLLGSGGLPGGVVSAGKNISTWSGKPTRYLTIPANPEAYGMRAGEFHDLQFKFVNRGGSMVPALVRNFSTPISIRHRKQKDGTIKTKIAAGAVQGGEVMFWLVRSVTVKADPSVLPYAEHMNARASEAIAAEVKTLIHRGGTTGGNN